MIMYLLHGCVGRTEEATLPPGAVPFSARDEGRGTRGEGRGGSGGNRSVLAPRPSPLTPPGRQIDPHTIISTERLTADTLELAAELPPGIDAVIAVARSGLVPGGLLAAWLHVPLWSVSRACGVIDPGHGYRLGADFQPSNPNAVRHLVIIDDTAATGREMPASVERVRVAFPGATITRAVVYCHPQAVGVVDLYHSILPGPHYLSWNWPNAGHGAKCGFDFDGILCADSPPGGWKGRDPTPLYLPRRRPIRLIVSGRGEEGRAHCNDWLARHSVRAERIILRDWPLDPALDEATQIGEWKGEQVKNADITMFAESDPYQAEWINRISGKAVLCPALGRVLPATAIRAAPVKRGCCH